jgi:hypothetical protein
MSDDLDHKKIFNEHAKVHFNWILLIVCIGICVYFLEDFYILINQFNDQ